jgi:amino acid permease
MKEPKKFPGVLSAVMLVVAILFGGAGAVGYMAYGSDIQTVVLVNLPQEDKFVQAVQFLCTSAPEANCAPADLQTRSLSCFPSPFNCSQR